MFICLNKLTHLYNVRAAAPDKWDPVSRYDTEQESQPSNNRTNTLSITPFVNARVCFVCVLLCKLLKTTINTHSRRLKKQLVRSVSALKFIFIMKLLCKSA